MIAISRSYGAGGRTVGRMVAQQLGIPFYDKSLLASTAQRSGLSVQYVASIDEKARSLVEQIYTLDQPEPLHSIADRAQREVIEQIASAGGCVIVGRRADQVLAGRPNLLRVFITSSVENRAARIAQRDNLTADKALAQVRRADRERADYCNSLSSVKWGEAASYDLCLDTQHLGLEGAAELIVAAARLKQSNAERTAKGRSARLSRRAGQERPHRYSCHSSIKQSSSSATVISSSSSPGLSPSQAS